MIRLCKNFAILLVVIAFCASCYHLVDTSGKLSRIYVDDVQNATMEPQLGNMMRIAMTELLSHSGRRSKDRLPLDLKVVGMENNNVARAEIREKRSRDNDSDAYQTVLYRITITVQYTLELPEGKTLAGTVTGIGDLPKMHDRNVPLQHAIRLAANDAAKKIVDALNDAPQL